MQNMTHNNATFFVNGNAVRSTMAAVVTHRDLALADTLRQQPRASERGFGKRPCSGSAPWSPSESASASQCQHQDAFLFHGDAVELTVNQIAADARVLERRSDRSDEEIVERARAQAAAQTGGGTQIPAMPGSAAARASSRSYSKKPLSKQVAKMPAPIWAAFVLSRGLSS